jgi:glycosyltransferase involved in cell wall biosynthesis
LDLSIIIPLLNEEESINRLYHELVTALAPVHRPYELIFVDDGSSDQSLNILAEIQQKDSNVVVISFRKNFGQTAALSAGFDHAKGDIIVTLDADLQNDPNDIPKLLKKLDEGYDIVNGWRFERKDPFLTRRLPSIIANKIISFATNVKLNDYGCTLKAFRKEITQNIRLYGEMHRFIPAVASGMGISIAEVKVNHRPRKYGQSKYGISRTIRVVLDLITVKFLLNYATRPIHVFGLIGFISGSLGFTMALFLTIQRQFFNIPMANRPLLLLAIMLIFIGLQFITLGLIAELQARTYHESQDKPIYAIRKILKNPSTDSKKE